MCMPSMLIILIVALCRNIASCARAGEHDAGVHRLAERVWG
jgi:hypothetical protein